MEYTKSQIHVMAFPTETAKAITVRLTLRQREVLRQLGKGFGIKRVARELGISVGTVKTHVSLAYTALGTRNRIQALTRARPLLAVPEAMNHRHGTLGT